MTAIVGVLSRRGVAFAADSAATHITQTGQKITNHANKIFTLSKYNPVGVALFNNLDFMGIPWDFIIKMYRDNLGTTKFDTIKEYIDSFWKFLRDNNIPPIDIQDWFVGLSVSCYHNEVHNMVVKEQGELNDSNLDVYLEKFNKQIDSFKITFQKQKTADEFTTYTIEDFNKHKDSINNALSFCTVYLPSYPIEFKDRFIESLFKFLCTESHGYIPYTGLVFFGYGGKELFPSCHEYHISSAIDGHFKLFHCNSYVVSNLNNAVIVPFAQTDVTNTVIRAVEDKLRTMFYNNYRVSIAGFRNEIVSQMIAAKAPQQLIDILNGLNIEKYTGEYIKGMDQYIQDNYINPLIETVAYLSKEDLADMAESLVRMTCIKRRITSTQETVGGPVDVAVVTKGDGFIWMKRKHYFDPKLNPQFFERYNK